MQRRERYSVMLTLSAILLLANGSAIPDVFAKDPKITELTMLYESTSGASATITVTDKTDDSVDDAYNTIPNPVIVSDGDTFMVLPMGGDDDLKAKTVFYVNGILFDFNHKNDEDPEIHTSCSAPMPSGDDPLLTADVPEGDVIHTLTLVGWEYFGEDEDCIFTPPTVVLIVGGAVSPIDTTSLLLAGAQMNSAWLIPVIVSVIGIGIVIARKF